jgi:hypothetical protein
MTRLGRQVSVHVLAEASRRRRGERDRHDDEPDDAGDAGGRVPKMAPSASENSPSIARYSPPPMTARSTPGSPSATGALGVNDRPADEERAERDRGAEHQDQCGE